MNPKPLALSCMLMLNRILQGFKPCLDHLALRASLDFVVNKKQPFYGCLSTFSNVWCGYYLLAVLDLTTTIIYE